MNHQSPVAHLIYGPTASGKSTYARQLASDTNGVRFAIDEWMHGLFGADLSQEIDRSWVADRVVRCRSLIDTTALRVLAAGTDVVLESGLLRAADRDRALSTFERAGHSVAFVFVDADLAVRRRRVLDRNRQRGTTWSFNVTPLMFEAMENWYEPPGIEELRRSTLVTNGDDHGQA